MSHPTEQQIVQGLPWGLDQLSGLFWVQSQEDTSHISGVTGLCDPVLKVGRGDRRQDPLDNSPPGNTRSDGLDFVPRERRVVPVVPAE